MKTNEIIYTEEHNKGQTKYQDAVSQAHFLNEIAKKHWALLGYMLTTEQLKEAERLIIDEDLKRLAKKQNPEK